MIEENIKKIKANISKACEKTNQNAQDIKIIAVTKTIDHNALNSFLPNLTKNDITDIGENRVQEMLEKQPHINQNITWHMIGNLQRNKVKYIIGKIKMIHSLDSVKLATEIDRIAKRDGVIVDTLIEINIAAEQSKHGIDLAQTLGFANDLKPFSNINIKGLMTVAPYVKDAEENRGYFKKMKKMYDELRAQNPSVQYLSMGMTGDYQVAVEEGANMVRIGTGIFGSR